MTRGRLTALTAILAVGALLYLHDPVWIGGLTSGLRPWEEDPPGTRFRWTAGRASLFIPGDAPAVLIPLRSVFAGTVDVDVRADDRWLATIRLVAPDAWVQTALPLRSRPARRRYRRLDLHVSRVVPPFMLGVMVGEVRVVNATDPRSPVRFESPSENAPAARPVWDSDTPATRRTGSP